MAGKVFKNERNMNKITDIAIINRSAKNTATVHMRDRCAALGDGIIRKELSKLAKYVCFDNF